MNDLTLPAPPVPDPAAEDPQRRLWLQAGAAAGCVAAVAAAVPLASSFAPSERAKAMGAAVEVDVGDLPPGGLKTVEWRGKPVWIQRRTPQMLAALQGQDVLLADPTSARDDLSAPLRNPGRSLRPDLFVAIGICTHLGCSPTPVSADSAHPSVGEHWGGGFFCPCHGSTFDLAGRVFRNKPAPSNLEIPPHRYLGENRLLIGESDSV